MALVRPTNRTAEHSVVATECSGYGHPMDVEDRIDGFVAKFADPVQREVRGCRARLADRFPDAVQLVYDNYNFFVIGFGPTDRPSDAILSLACHRGGAPAWQRKRSCATSPWTPRPPSTVPTSRR